MRMSREKTKEQRKYEIAISLARMYGVKETLEPLAFLKNESVVEMVLQWSDEFLDSHSCDLVQFFEDKCAHVKHEIP